VFGICEKRFFDDYWLQLLPFLRDANPTVVAVALQTLVPYTAPSEPLRSVFLTQLPSSSTGTETYVSPLVDLAGSRDKTVAHEALKALINLSDGIQAATEIGKRTPEMVQIILVC
jgi:hypothetical protein